MIEQKPTGRKEVSMQSHLQLFSGTGYVLPSRERRLLDEGLDHRRKSINRFFEFRKRAGIRTNFHVLELAGLVPIVSWNGTDQNSKTYSRERHKMGRKSSWTHCQKRWIHTRLAWASWDQDLSASVIFLATSLLKTQRDQNQLRLNVIEDFRRAIEFSQRAKDAYSMSLAYVWLGLYSGAQEALSEVSWMRRRSKGQFSAGFCGGHAGLHGILGFKLRPKIQIEQETWLRKQ